MLFTFSYAGGSSFSYSNWHSLLHRNQLHPLDYKGHGLRLEEPPDTTFDAVVDDMTRQILSFNPLDGQFLLYGHSMGSLVAFYTARALIEHHHLSPAALIVGACFSPAEFELHKELITNDEELLQYLKNHGRIPETVLHSPMFQKDFFPLLLNDFSLLNQFHYTPVSPLDIPLIALAGDADKEASLSLMHGWSQFTTFPYRGYSLKGEHFFLDGNAEKICHLIDGLPTR